MKDQDNNSLRDTIRKNGFVCQQWMPIKWGRLDRSICCNTWQHFQISGYLPDTEIHNRQWLQKHESKHQKNNCKIKFLLFETYISKSRPHQALYLSKFLLLAYNSQNHHYQHDHHLPITILLPKITDNLPDPHFSSWKYPVKIRLASVNIFTVILHLVTKYCFVFVPACLHAEFTPFWLLTLKSLASHRIIVGTAAPLLVWWIE